MLLSGGVFFNQPILGLVKVAVPVAAFFRKSR